MAIAFFVSSIGDTDLAKATIAKLIEQRSVDSIFVIPLTMTAAKRTEDLLGVTNIHRISLEEITKQSDILSKKKITSDDLEKISNFVNEKNIQRAYVGVPSPIDEEIPYQIANYLKIPCTIAYEFMFKPTTHAFWNYTKELSSKENCDFAVPLKRARHEILEINPHARIHEVGHLSIDRSLSSNTVDTASIRKSLFINENDELVFISGTTQPTEVDNKFLEALLNEISTGKYPNLKLRFGIHPGIKDLDTYLKIMLEMCEKYPAARNQFKFIIPDQIEQRLQKPLPSNHPFVLRSNVSGQDATNAANKVAQAVPGALLNESVLKGKPSYYHDQTTQPYLPESWFAKSISVFFTMKQTPSHAHKELDLQDTAPSLCAKLMSR